MSTIRFRSDRWFASELPTGPAIPLLLVSHARRVCCWNLRKKIKNKTQKRSKTVPILCQLLWHLLESRGAVQGTGLNEGNGIVYSFSFVRFDCYDLFDS